MRVLKLIGRALAIIIPFAIFTTTVSAGQLNDFEKDATKVRKSESAIVQNSNSSSTSATNDEDDCTDMASCIIGGLFEFMFRIIFESITAGSTQTERVIKDAANDDVQQPSEKTVLASAESQEYDYVYDDSRSDKVYSSQLSSSYQQANSAVSAADYRFDISVGTAARFNLRFSSFEESLSNDSLDLFSASVWNRISFSRNWNTGIGAGFASLQGNASTQGISLHLPTSYLVNRYLDLELLPSLLIFNGTRVIDLDMSANFHYKNAGLKLGFRSLRSPNEDITGPYIGLLMRF